ncbi:hypothetical protein ACQEV4_31280 [Streptomyces shenzhenensis]|uniref:hypothetical protein n=1 Tax=Streptomyces shenzhenensis TaxID=943815 RepID=UPI003D9356B1
MTKPIEAPPAEPATDGRAAGRHVPSATELAAVLVSAFFGAQHISWLLNDRADLAERTIIVVRTVIRCAEQDFELCPSVPRR